MVFKSISAVPDHQPPFEELVRWFIIKYEVDIEAVEYIKEAPGEKPMIRFKNDEMSEKFRKFHADHGVIRIVYREVNLREGPKQRIKKVKNPLPPIAESRISQPQQQLSLL